MTEQEQAALASLLDKYDLTHLLEELSIICAKNAALKKFNAERKTKEMTYWHDRVDLLFELVKLAEESIVP